MSADLGSRRAVRALVACIDPFDDIEQGHRSDTLAWIDSGAPLWRTAKPATPPTHLVAYSVLIDPIKQQVLLVDHRSAGLWLPTGGHIDQEEDPAAAAGRELTEELGIEARPLPAIGAGPLMVTVATTVGGAEPHEDVSLWYGFAASVDTPLTPDPREFADVAWWPIDAVSHGLATRFDPNIPRFLAKLGRLPR